MKKNTFLLFILSFAANFSSSQVGINTINPNAQLEIKSSNQAVPENTDGIIIPKIDAFPITNPTASQQSMLVYLTTTNAGKQPGFYYWDDTTTSWLSISGAKSWELQGNAGTNPLTNFIGTTDDANIIFKRNNNYVGLLGENNVSFGTNSLNLSTTGSYNIALGVNNLTNNTSGSGNIAIGGNTLFSNTNGVANYAIGANSLYTNISGNYNLAFGPSSLFSNTTGTNNIALGWNTLFSNSTGNSNVALGTNSLQSNTTGFYNTAIGSSSLAANTTGSYNCSLGMYSLNSNTSGSYNSAFGYRALYNNRIGTNNIAIASDALYNNTNGHNNVALGLNSLYNNTIGNHNFAVGYLSMSANVSGQYNIALGYNSGGNITGSSNISIGSNSNVPILGGSNQLSIGNAIYGTSIGNSSLSKIGIGSTIPNSKFEISSSNQATPANTDGIIIPKIDAFPATNPTASQQSMLVYLTTTNAGKQPGFYYWDNTTTSWIGINSTINADTDWLKSGTGTTPNNSDQMYHSGAVAIGWNSTPVKTLDVRGNGINNISGNEGIINSLTNDSSANSYGEYTTLTGNSSGMQVGNYIRFQNLTSHTAEHDGIFIDMQNINTNFNNRNGIRLEISGSATGGGSHIGLSNNINSISSFGKKIGVQNSISGTGENYGILNSFSSYGVGIKNYFYASNGGVGTFNQFSTNSNNPNYGSYSQFSANSTGTNYNVYNEMSYGLGTEYGIYNDMRNISTGVTSPKYGSYTIIDGTGTGAKYGTYNLITNTAGGTHYGIYSDVTKSGSFAGYFLGNVSIGTTAANNYILPVSRGINGQIMQTDGSGNVSWANPSVQKYTTTGSSTGIYSATLSEYTIRVFNGISEIQLPNAAGNQGKIFVIIGSNGITSKIFSTLGGVIYDDVTNSSISILNPNERYTVQSDGTDWIVIAR